MSVLIKGMEMPDFGERIIVLTSSGYVEDVSGTVIQGVEAVSVPDHGRLIDASEKIKVQIYDDMTEDFQKVEMTIDDLLSRGWVEANAPTVIPADKEEANGN